MYLLIQRWITNAYHKGKDEGLDTGFRLGYQQAELDMANSEYSEIYGVKPRSLVDKQIEIIVKREEF